MKALSLSESIPDKGHRALTTEHVESLGDQGSFPRQQGDQFGPARAVIARGKAPEEGPLNGGAAVGDKVNLQMARFRTLQSATVRTATC